MSAGGLAIRILGARGSTPASGPAFERHGGHTTSLEIALDPDHRLLLDCGTGLRRLGPGLQEPTRGEGCRFLVFLTHYHWDHIEGLPFFEPLYDPRSAFHFFGFGWDGRDVRAILETALGPPWFPIGLARSPSRKTYESLAEGSIEVWGLRLTIARLHHPQGVAGFRLDHGGRSVVLATDHEPGDPRADAALVELARGADVLIHDAQFTPEEYEASRRGWGHSTWRHATDAAARASVGRLVLTHHAPDRTDEALDAIVERARAVFPEVEAAREGMVLSLS